MKQVTVIFSIGVNVLIDEDEDLTDDQIADRAKEDLREQGLSNIDNVIDGLYFDTIDNPNED